MTSPLLLLPCMYSKAKLNFPLEIPAPPDADLASKLDKLVMRAAQGVKPKVWGS